MSRTALLVIDVQNDYFPQGKMALFGAEQALTNINRLEADFIKNAQPIIYIQHIAKQAQATFFKREQRVLNCMLACRSIKTQSSLKSTILTVSFKRT